VEINKSRRANTMTEQVAEKTQASPQIQEEAKKVLDQEEVAEQTDVVLEARLKADGGISWKIPPNLMAASYLLQVLETGVKEMMASTIKASMLKPKDDIKSKLIKLPGFLGGRRK